MNERRPAEVFPPGEFIRDELEERSWTQADLAEILGRPVNAVNEIITGKKAITPETAKGLASAFGTTPEVWLNLESTYQLWKAKSGDEDAVALRAKLYSKAPIRDMVKRGWIESSRNPDVLGQELTRFFGIRHLDEDPLLLPHAARKSSAYSETTPAQRAWLFRARQLAESVHAAHFNRRALSDLVPRLRECMLSPEEIRVVPAILAEAGIRLLVVEPLPGTRIDGACLWLDRRSPVVVVSMRYDRIDAFWFTLMHELAHVRREDGLREELPPDVNLIGEGSGAERPPFESEADQIAAEALIPSRELDSFIARVGPLYSKVKIRGFAALQGVHPGIVVGQLQYRREIDWSHSRDMLVKVREIITQSALTDGWGHKHAVQS